MPHTKPHTKEARDVAKVIDSLQPDARAYIRSMVYRVAAVALDAANPKKKKSLRRLLSLGSLA